MDTGGFFRPADQYTNPSYHQLLIRWFQFAVFTPIFRVHGCNSNTELWNYPSTIQNTILQSAIRLRYRLLEYIYSGFERVERDHYTMQRGLVLDFWDDENSFNIADQFMFGQSFLVAPIYTPDSSRVIYLPELSRGGRWRCFFSGNKFEDGRTVQFDHVAIMQIPLFVRSSILILGPDGRQHVGDLPDGALEVRVFDGADSTFHLFEDDGLNGDPNRPTITISFSWNEHSKTLTIGEAPISKTRAINVVLVRPGVGVGIDPTPQPDAVLSYDGRSISLKLGGSAAEI
jgi:alpha-D-xyloside xylohydrolase